LELLVKIKFCKGKKTSWLGIINVDLDNKTVKERKSTKNPESRRQRGGQPKKHLSTVNMVDGAQEAVDHCPLEV
jgi:hypothetical protein